MFHSVQLHTHTHTLAVHRCHRCVHCARHSDPPLCYHFCIARSVSPCRRLEPTLYSFSFCAAAPAVSKEDGCRPGAQHVTTVVRSRARRTPWDHLYCVPMMYRSLLLRLGAFLDVLVPPHRYVTRLNFSLLMKRINVTTVGRRRHRHAMRRTTRVFNRPLFSDPEYMQSVRCAFCSYNNSQTK